MPRRAPLHCREIDGPLRVVAPMTIRGIDGRSVRKGSSRAPNLMQPIAVGRAAVRYAGVHSLFVEGLHPVLPVVSLLHVGALIDASATDRRI